MSLWRRVLRSPALHMAAIGGAMFAASAVRGGAAFEARPRLVVERHRLELMAQGFVQDNYRRPTPEERARMIDTLVDDEVLYQYALALHMEQNPAAQQRLAKIAEFVDANPHEPRSEAELASEAMDLGLGQGDLVVRRILVDSARRLIRGVVMIRDPKPELVERYYREHGEELARPARVRISLVTANGFRWPDSAARARELLARIRAQSLGLDEALALGDESLVEPNLPELTEHSLATELGYELASAVMKLPVGEWSGPIPSRYGDHLVWVHEREEARVPPLDEVRETVTDRVRQKVADEYLRLRLEELRAGYDIVVPEPTPRSGASS